MSAPFRYRRLGYVALNVSDIDKTSRFATEVFGLDQVAEAADGTRFFRSGQAHHDVVVAPAGKPGFVRSAWELERDAELDIAFDHFRGAGMQPQWMSDKECAGLRLQRAFRVTDAVAGATWEYYAEMTYLSTPRTNTLTTFQGGKHFGMAVPDCKAMTGHAIQQLGFLVSDYFEGNVLSLMRAWPNPNHHSIAFVESPGAGPRFHHLAFMVQTIDDIGRLLNRVKRYGVQVQWGIGRHPTSGSIHLYIYDPDHIVWEYTLGMEQFAEQGARPPRRFTITPEEFDLWGAVPDSSHAADMPPVLTAAPHAAELRSVMA
ncbi:VOC family protein [Caenimonas soli]|uniref:VOC family protein n=1 Tax=Caenimonas soli TaxID=2735555 RepID=UPI0015572A1A|nr:VOC family protein [Caenimonas soli]NPC55924.1 bleomycin resistance protein [Caenimonas soli]